MTIVNPEPNNTTKIEPKVTAASVASYLAGFGGLAAVEIVGLLTDNNNELLLAVVPDPIEIFILPFVPGLIALAAGFRARHQWRASETPNG